MLGWQFRQELEQVHTVQALAQHLERFLNAGYAVCRQPNGMLVLLPDTVALQPFQTFTLELLADDHHGKYFRVKSRDLDAAFDIYDCSLFRGSVKHKLGSLIVYWHGMVQSKLIDLWWTTHAKIGTPPGQVLQSRRDSRR